MAGNDGQDSRSFPMGETAQEKGFDYVPDCYMIPTSSRPSLNPETANFPTIDMNGIHNTARRNMIVNDISNACKNNGIFQIVNHGISQNVLDDALSAAFSFFNLPTSEKMKLISNDVHKPVRYGTSLKDGVDKIQFWRVFLKHYANPLEDWINLWPDNPCDYSNLPEMLEEYKFYGSPYYYCLRNCDLGELYRFNSCADPIEKMGKYTKEVQKLAITILGLITEGLGIGPEYLTNKIEEGMQVMVVNGYPPCPEPDLALGLPPHSDYSVLTILLQSSPGLQIWDDSNERPGWKTVQNTRGVLQVNIGDHLEVLSNGLYRSRMHRAAVNNERTRISIVSLHSLGMDEKMETAEKLVDENHPKRYRGSSFRDFLNFLVENDIIAGYKNFIDTVRIENVDRDVVAAEN